MSIRSSGSLPSRSSRATVPASARSTSWAACSRPITTPLPMPTALPEAMGRASRTATRCTAASSRRKAAARSTPMPRIRSTRLRSRTRSPTTNSLYIHPNLDHGITTGTLQLGVSGTAYTDPGGFNGAPFAPGSIVLQADGNSIVFPATRPRTGHAAAPRRRHAGIRRGASQVGLASSPTKKAPRVGAFFYACVLFRVLEAWSYPGLIAKPVRIPA